jgi:hypothetical protein
LKYIIKYENKMAGKGQITRARKHMYRGRRRRAAAAAAKKKEEEDGGGGG